MKNKFINFNLILAIILCTTIMVLFYILPLKSFMALIVIIIGTYIFILNIIKLYNHLTPKNKEEISFNFLLAIILCVTFIVILFYILPIQSFLMLVISITGIYVSTLNMIKFYKRIMYKNKKESK